MTTSSVLIVGATGRTGLAVATKFASLNAENRPEIHAFCRNRAKFERGTAALFDSIIEGDARSSKDLARALEATKPDAIVLSVGNGDSVAKSDIRTANAMATVEALKSDEEMFGNIRVICISSTGAGGSKIKVGMGIGKLIEHHLRHVLSDHDGQEVALLGDSSVKHRTVIVRPTSLTEGAPTDQALIEFGDKVKSPTIKTDRADLSTFVVTEFLSAKHQGMAVNVTGVKKSKQ